MKYIIFTICIFISNLLVSAQNTKLTIDLSKYFQCPQVSIKDNESRKVLDYDSTRIISLNYDLDKASYLTLYVDGSINQIYLTPGRDLKMTAVPDKTGIFNVQHLQFWFEGPDADINNYLNSRQLEMMKDDDFLLDEAAYIKKIEKLEKQNAKVVRSYKLDKNFEKEELLRVRYKLLESLTRYPVQHHWKGGNQLSIMLQYEDSPIVRKYISKLLVEDENAWKEAEYQRFVKSAVAILATTDFSIGWEKAIQKRIDVLTKHFKSQQILEDMIQDLMLIYVERTEGDSLKSLNKYYEQYVTKPEYKQELQNAYTSWKRFQQGEQVISGDATYQDVNGKMVSLNDLKGKYIYIDVWATWCGPCRAELPYLKKLEADFHARNIYFVSISMDQRKKDWVKMVEKEQLTGIQLIGGPNAQIAKDYKIMGIPRFILLDREGKMINGDMSSPSNPETRKVLESLEGI